MSGIAQLTTDGSPQNRIFTTQSGEQLRVRKALLSRPIAERVFELTAVAATGFALLVLLILLVSILSDGLPRVNWQFLSSYPSRRAESAGILSSLVGSALLMVLIVVISFPIGVGAAIYLEEYATKNRFTHLLELNIANLAGVPSVIYGLLGLQIFVRVLSLERSLLAGALTLSLLILPVIIISAREGLRTVPRSIREAALALGATRWQMVRQQVLPVAMPGILTGCILAFSRAIGETAPLVTLGALTYIPFVPDSTWIAISEWSTQGGIGALGIALRDDLLSPFTCLLYTSDAADE